MNSLNLSLVLPLLLAGHGVMAEAPDFSGDLKASAARGEQLWSREFTVSGQQRSCASCHGANPGAQGKHQRTGKAIAPMAPVVNSRRLTDTAKVEKWFKRNCKWTMGRECTRDEKGDFLAYLRNWKEK